MKRLLLSIFLISILTSCNSTQTEEQNAENEVPDKFPISKTIVDSITLSTKHNPNFITGDLDGDELSDSIKIVLNKNNSKYGLKVIFGNKKVVYLGLGKDILGQGFDDLDWVGIFEKAPKGEVYFNNVSEEGDLMTEDQVKESDKIKLPNDGIFIHQAESCGGGVIYLKDGEFEWIQQD